MEDNILIYNRRPSRIVNIGDVPLGGHYPIRVQSMTTTDTMNTEQTVAQSIRMIEAGCEYVRITAPSLKEAENLAVIKKELRARGFQTPLIADIHFTPNAAELAARLVEKVRINPGNYVDKKKFEQKEYSDAEYIAEIERIQKRFEPLVKICKEYGTAMRIGTNHGSLSDRIMNRYGDTPEGMVESAMEFLRICNGLNYHNIVLSMKSSNPIVMIQAYRLLVKQMDMEGMNYPLHLGVTEAGEQEEGRIKSAMGIGTLLEEGLGDTIRVSLTEAPEFEIPVAKKLVTPFNNAQPNVDAYKFSMPELQNRHESLETSIFGAGNVPRVIADLSQLDSVHELTLKTIDYHYDDISDKWNMGELGADFIYFGNLIPDFSLPNGAKGIFNYNIWKTIKDKTNNYPYFNENDEYPNQMDTLHFLEISRESLSDSFIMQLKKHNSAILVINKTAQMPLKSIRTFCRNIRLNGLKQPVVLKAVYNNIDEESFILKSSTEVGGAFAEGIGNGIWLNYKQDDNANHLLNIIRLVNRTAFNILQASRSRISKTEYISCPSCGRTLFDLQETTAMIRAKTDHLKGVKIAIMGCIVNGPGEMADADYGYVGTGPGKITLYKGKEVVKRNIESKNALNELINLIKDDGYWIDKHAI